MTTTPIKRSTVAVTLLMAGLAGSISPAAADEGPSTCDPVVLSAAVDSAATQARTARKAFTHYTRSAMKTQVAALKIKESRESRDAVTSARQAAAQAKAALAQARKAHDDAATEAARQARVEARAAAVKARAEAREASRVRHASKRQLVALVKAERARLKTVWTQAKAALAQARSAVDACEPQAETPSD